MDFERYANEKWADYSAFAETVASILGKAIRSDPALRLQHIQHRAKDTLRLRQKLDDRGLLNTETLEKDIKDLAGCRLVFYTNSDVSKFLNSRIVDNNFEIDWERTKIHHPRPGSDKAAELFISNNYVVALKDSRTSLAEYAQHRGMWCEVQIQTSLNHAWSEMAHDTIYKKPRLKGYGTKLLSNIEKRMESVMREHLLPAGYEFQKVADDFERLRAGKELFDRGALEALAECPDNNARYELLERFNEYVLPNYDDLEGVCPDIQIQIVTAVKAARETPTRTIETPFGTLPGHSAEKITEIAVHILERLRYIDVKSTFDIICELFLGTDSADEHTHLLQLAIHLSEHQLDVWEQAGAYVQATLAESIGELDEQRLEPLRPILVAILTEILKPEVQGTSSTYRTMTISSGAVQAVERLIEARAQALATLKKLYCSAETNSDRKSASNALYKATTLPRSVPSSAPLNILVLKNSHQIVEFYNGVAKNQSYEMLLRLERDVFDLYRRNQKEITKEPHNSDLLAERKKLTENIEAFRDQLNSDRDYVIYKTLARWDSVLSPSWESGDFEYKVSKEYRQTQITEFVESVTTQNAEDWFKRLKQCTDTEGSDSARFQTLDSFFHSLGQKKPNIVLGYLKQMERSFAPFLPSMLRGLANSKRADEALERLSEWIDQGAYLQNIASYLCTTPEFDPDLLKTLSSKAIEIGDEKAALNSLRAAVAQYEKRPDELIDTVFMPALDFLAIKGNRDWVAAIGYDPGSRSLLQDLEEGQAKSVLQNMISLPEINYYAEQVIKQISVKFLPAAVDYFGERITYSSDRPSYVEYNDIPFEFDELDEYFSKDIEYVVDSARSWFQDDSDLFQFRGGRFIAITFPAFPDDLQNKLKFIMQRGHRKDVQFVVAILRSYRGEPFLQEICKDIVDILPEDDDLLNDIEIALEPTGFTRGEFGRVEALIEKREEIKQWLSDVRPKVRAFSQRHVHSLDQLIASDQRRSEERLEKRKRDFGN